MRPDPDPLGDPPGHERADEDAEAADPADEPELERGQPELACRRSTAIVANAMFENRFEIPVLAAM